MMNEATSRFVCQHTADDVRVLALHGTKDEGVDLRMALQQIKGRQTARRKLPSWAAVDAIVYPPHLNMEQCSSEQTARYKAALCQRISEKPLTLLDLTGGFGVDFAFMSQAFQASTYVERDAALCAIATENFKTLGLKAKTVCADGVDYLRQFLGQIGQHEGQRECVATVIYLDPARRDSNGARTFGIADCTPNVLDIRDLLLASAQWVVLKLSPMLDWQKAVSDLGPERVSEVHIVSVGNECKELLVVMSSDEGRRQGCQVYCVNDDAVFTFAPSTAVPLRLWDEADANALWLYEPNASIMKAGCFARVAEAFDVRMLSANSHLCVSDTLCADFPGRTFRVSAVSSMNKRELRACLKDIRQANITVRNFPLSVAQLRQKLHLSEGGSDYLFATTLADGRHVLFLCRHH